MPQEPEPYKQASGRRYFIDGLTIFAKVLLVCDIYVIQSDVSRERTFSRAMYKAA